MSEKESKIKTLFQEIQRGSRDAFNHLFNLYYTKLVAFARQYTGQMGGAEEICSELFVKLWLKRNSLSGILNPEVYLYVSVKNACLNLIRSEKKRANLFSEEEGHPSVEITSRSYSSLEDKELMRLLTVAVSSLPEQRKIIFRLIKEDGFKAAEVAQILGISKRTVENQLYKAVKTLADAISTYLGYHPQSGTVKRQLSKLSMFLFV